LLVAGIVLLAAACGDDDDAAPSDGSTATTSAETTNDSASTTPTPATASAEFCGPMEELANFNAESPALDPTGDWAAVQEELVNRGNGAMGLYDDVIAVAPDEATSQLETLRDYSQEVIDTAAEATSAEDFATQLGTPPSEVLTAATELNDYIAAACGFELTSGG
jgi:hypothetical protein